MDLGLSSMQLDASGRGFSFRLDEPLDMRFDPTADLPTAAELLNSLPEAEIERILREFGEEPRARRAAMAIRQRRPVHPPPHPHAPSTPPLRPPPRPIPPPP